jgi:hypothetical protein
MWATAALNLAAAAGPSLKSSGPKWDLPSNDDDFGGMASVYLSFGGVGEHFGLMRFFPLNRNAK